MLDSVMLKARFTFVNNKLLEWPMSFLTFYFAVQFFSSSKTTCFVVAITRL